MLDDTPSSSSSSARKLDFCSTVDNNIISNAPAECETTILSSLNVLALPLDSRTPSNYYIIYISYVLLPTLLITLISTNSFVR